MNLQLFKVREPFFYPLDFLEKSDDKDDEFTPPKKSPSEYLEPEPLKPESPNQEQDIPIEDI